MTKRRAEPGIVPVQGARILFDKEISLETAKLLGVPFTYGGCGKALKYVHTRAGPKKLSRVLISDIANPDPIWREGYAEYLDVEFEDEPINWD